MPSRRNGDCSRFAPTRRAPEAHRPELMTRGKRGLLTEHQLIELLGLRLVQLGHQMAVAVGRDVSTGIGANRPYWITWSARLGRD